MTDEETLKLLEDDCWRCRQRKACERLEKNGGSPCRNINAISALRDRIAREKPEPLTLEQLREMDGEPVYLVDMEPVEYGWEDGWYLVNADEDMAFNGIRKYDLKFCVGFAYRRPPERSQNDA